MSEGYSTGEPVEWRGSHRRSTKLYVVFLTAVSVGMWTVMVLVRI